MSLQHRDIMRLEERRKQQRNDIVAERDQFDGKLLLLLADHNHVAVRPIGASEQYPVARLERQRSAGKHMHRSKGSLAAIGSHQDVPVFFPGNDRLDEMDEGASS